MFAAETFRCRIVLRVFVRQASAKRTLRKIPNPVAEGARMNDLKGVLVADCQADTLRPKQPQDPGARDRQSGRVYDGMCLLSSLGRRERVF